MMNLKEYAQYKFRLAEVICFASAVDFEHEKGSELRWRDVLARLAEDRFNVVVAGRFNRGKSTLMNALLGMGRLPTGIVPLTSVITTVRYGTSERVLLDYEGSGLRGEVLLNELADYVTEKGNPGNRKRIRSAEIQLPAEILRRGFFFVDTHGLGSAIFENTETTERFIPEIDVLILVTGYESPLTEDEIRFLNQATSSVRAVFVVLNKHDTVSQESRSEVLTYAEHVIRGILDGKAPKPFSLSARDGLAASDAEALQASGIREFEEELIQFLTTQKAELFLDSLCDRVLAELAASAGSELGDATHEILALKEQVHAHVAQPRPQGSAGLAKMRPLRLQPAGLCEICGAVLKKPMEFLSRHQCELTTRPEVQIRHAANGGFCPLHTWHYEEIASPHGVCTAYPALLNRFADKLRGVAQSQATAEGLEQALPQSRCPACEVRWSAEDKAVQYLLARRANLASWGAGHESRC